MAHTRKHGHKKHGHKRRGTRKVGHKAMKWTSFVSKIHKELKKRNPKAKLGDAMKEASRRKREM
ncbi:hypothetical protein EBR66_02430 [bacterium]|nr:hypothetical protein [bacterium]